jgi:serine/threonine protein phosphatase 1
LPLLPKRIALPRPAFFRRPLVFRDSRRRPAPRLPDGVRVYAIGDLHGRADLLATLHDKIAADAGGRPGLNIAIYLGDYVDRGLWSKDTIDLALAGPAHGFRCHWLKGNHEAALLGFLEDPASGAAWLAFGGRETLQSYGLTPPQPEDDPQALTCASDALLDRLPLAHLEFFEMLELSVAYGDYLFVHAGIRPGLPLERQMEEDMLWIRQLFLASRADHGKVVVHGHTTRRRPAVRRNRIAIDTAAYRSGRLTCLVLEGEERRFLST